MEFDVLYSTGFITNGVGKISNDSVLVNRYDVTDFIVPANGKISNDSVLVNRYDVTDFIVPANGKVSNDSILVNANRGIAFRLRGAYNYEQLIDEPEKVTIDGYADLDFSHLAIDKIMTNSEVDSTSELTSMEPHLGNVLNADSLNSIAELTGGNYFEEYWAIPTSNLGISSQISNTLLVDKLFYGLVLELNTQLSNSLVVDRIFYENNFESNGEILNDLAVGFSNLNSTILSQTSLESSQFINNNVYVSELDGNTEIDFSSVGIDILVFPLNIVLDILFDSINMEQAVNPLTTNSSLDSQLSTGVVEAVPMISTANIGFDGLVFEFENLAPFNSNTNITFNLEEDVISHVLDTNSDLDFDGAISDVIIRPSELTTGNSLYYLKIIDVFINNGVINAQSDLSFLPDTNIYLTEAISTNLMLLYMLGELKTSKLTTYSRLTYNIGIFYDKLTGHDYFVKTERFNYREENKEILEKTGKIIGTGVDFPFEYDHYGVDRNVGIEVINDSIEMILSTCKGSRFFEPEFGSNLCRLVFEPIDNILFEKLKVEVVDALRKWEKRIKIRKVEISDKDMNAINNGIVYITVYYLIRNTQIEGNYVYPFKTENYYKRI